MAKGVAPQRFLSCSKASVDEARAAFAPLAARFSFTDFPDFLVVFAEEICHTALAP
jgi:hypothetical protein